MLLLLLIANGLESLQSGMSSVSCQSIPQKDQGHIRKQEPSELYSNLYLESSSYLWILLMDLKKS